MLHQYFWNEEQLPSATTICKLLTPANVLATLQAAWGTTVTCVFLQEKGTAVSATNPLYTVSLLINNTTDINGAVGDIGTQSITFTAAVAGAAAAPPCLAANCLASLSCWASRRTTDQSSGYPNH